MTNTPIAIIAAGKELDRAQMNFARFCEMHLGEIELALREQGFESVFDEIKEAYDEWYKASEAFTQAVKSA